MVAPALSSPHPVGAKLGTKVAAYVALTKPRIIELLLVTTFPAMFLAAGGFVLGDAVLALLGQLFDDGDDGGIVEFDALVDFLLLDGGEQQADGGQLGRFLGLHGRFHVFGDACFEAHFVALQEKSPGKKTKPAAVREILQTG